MDIVGYAIITAALIAIAGIIYYISTYYIAQNMLSLATYVESLVYEALTHDFQSAVTLASMGQVTGSFTYVLTLPTSAMPVGNVALTYVATLYPAELPSGGVGLYANISVVVMSGPWYINYTRTKLPIMSSAQPVTIIALNCGNSNEPVTLVNSTWANPPSGIYCRWSSLDVAEGRAMLIVSKG